MGNATDWTQFAGHEMSLEEVRAMNRENKNYWGWANGMFIESGKIEETDDIDPYNPGNNYNGTLEDCRNRFASVRGLPDGAD